MRSRALPRSHALRGNAVKGALRRESRPASGVYGTPRVLHCIPTQRVGTSVSWAFVYNDERSVWEQVNQMPALPLGAAAGRIHIGDLLLQVLNDSSIATAAHCLRGGAGQ